MAVEHRKIIDRIQPVKAITDSIRDRTSDMESTPEENQGLKFKPGDIVQDKVTGEVFRVARGKRAYYEISTPEETRG